MKLPDPRGAHRQGCCCGPGPRGVGGRCDCRRGAHASFSLPDAASAASHDQLGVGWGFSRGWCVHRSATTSLASMPGPGWRGAREVARPLVQAIAPARPAPSRWPIEPTPASRTARCMSMWAATHGAAHGGTRLRTRGLGAGAAAEAGLPGWARRREHDSVCDERFGPVGASRSRFISAKAPGHAARRRASRPTILLARARVHQSSAPT